MSHKNVNSFKNSGYRTVFACPRHAKLRWIRKVGQRKAQRPMRTTERVWDGGECKNHDPPSKVEKGRLTLQPNTSILRRSDRNSSLGFDTVELTGDIVLTAEGFTSKNLSTTSTTEKKIHHSG